jgi:uncharacterized protein YkwD
MFLSIRARTLLPLATIMMAVVASFIALGLGSRPAAALTSCTVSESDVSLDAQESQFLTLINNYRAANRLAPLTVSTNLNRASAWMALDMGQKGYFDHTDSLGRSPSTRATNCGYPGGAGENIAAGTIWDTAQEVFTAWQNSPGHNANMLNSSYKMIGIARANVAGSQYGWYWVTDFGLVNDGTSGGGTTATATATPTRTTTATPTRTATATPTRTATTTPTRTASATPTKTASATQTTPPAAATTPSGSTSAGVLISPAPGSRLTSNTVTFSWTAGSGSQYILYIGRSKGGSDILNRSTGSARSLTVSTLPAGGQTLYIRIWTFAGGRWLYSDATVISR